MASEEEEHQQVMISAFLDVAESQTPETARRFLQAAGWDFENALHRFFTAEPDQVDAGKSDDDSKSSMSQEDDDYYQEDYLSDAYSDYVAETDSDSPTHATMNRQNTNSLFPPPYDLNFGGLFERAKQEARWQNRWLLVNLQNREKLSSLELDRDTWNDKTVIEVIKSNFIFWQEYVYHYHDTSEGAKVGRYYKQQQDSLPVIMVIEPITGAVTYTLARMVLPEDLLQKLLAYTESNPLEYCINLSRRNKLPNSHNAMVQDHGTEYAADDDDVRELGFPADDHQTEDAADDDHVRELSFPSLPEEPNIDDAKLVCRVGVRLPDGRRIQRRFLQSDPVQLLWSFCCSELDDAEKNRPFHIAFASVPGCMGRSLDYNSSLTVEESGLANCMLSVLWD